MQDRSRNSGTPLREEEEPLVIRARGVTKRFGDFAAIQELDLDVRAGECVGLLGPNGAGKSTFIGCLYGVVLRSGGSLHVFGYDPTIDRAASRRLALFRKRTPSTKN
jgi:lipooligosaccharide transport system ATP-binding protein